MKAILKQYRQSPRKVRLVADLIKGKNVDKALSELQFTDKRASLTIRKLLSSAIAGAKNNFNTAREDLFIKDITVNKGPTLSRWIPRARGRATPINKRTSHITLILGEQRSGPKRKKGLKVAQKPKADKEKK